MTYICPCDPNPKGFPSVFTDHEKDKLYLYLSRYILTLWSRVLVSLLNISAPTLRWPPVRKCTSRPAFQLKNNECHIRLKCDRLLSFNKVSRQIKSKHCQRHNRPAFVKVNCFCHQSVINSIFGQLVINLSSTWSQAVILKMLSSCPDAIKSRHQAFNPIGQLVCKRQSRVTSKTIYPRILRIKMPERGHNMEILG